MWLVIFGCVLLTVKFLSVTELTTNLIKPYIENDPKSIMNKKIIATVHVLNKSLGLSVASFFLNSKCSFLIEYSRDMELPPDKDVIPV